MPSSEVLDLHFPKAVAVPTQGSPSAQHSRRCIPSPCPGMSGLMWSGQIMEELTGWAWADPTAASATWEPRAGAIPGEQQQEPQGPAPPFQEWGRHLPFICHLSPFSSLLLNCSFDRTELWAIPFLSLNSFLSFVDRRGTNNSQHILSCILRHCSFYWEKNPFCVKYCKDKMNIRSVLILTSTNITNQGNKIKKQNNKPSILITAAVKATQQRWKASPLQVLIAGNIPCSWHSLKGQMLWKYNRVNNFSFFPSSSFWTKWSLTDFF